MMKEKFVEKYGDEYQNYQKVIQTTREVREFLNKNYSDYITNYLEMVKVHETKLSRTNFNVSLEDWFSRIDHFNQVYELDEEVIDVLVENAKNQTLSLSADEFIVANYFELITTLYLKKDVLMSLSLLINELPHVIHDEMIRNKEYLTVTQFVLAKLYFVLRLDVQTYIIEEYKEDLVRYMWEEIFNSKTTGELQERKEDIKEHLEYYAKNEGLIYGGEIENMNVRIGVGENKTMEMDVKLMLDKTTFLFSDIYRIVNSVIQHLEDILADLVIIQHVFDVDIPAFQFFDDIVSSERAKTLALEMENLFLLRVNEFLHMIEVGYEQLLTFNYEYFEGN